MADASTKHGQNKKTVSKVLPIKRLIFFTMFSRNDMQKHKQTFGMTISKVSKSARK